MSPTPETLLAAALEISGRDERRAYLDRACAGHDALRQEVESLLAAHEQAGGFMSLPAAGTPPPLPAEMAGDRIGRYRLLEPIGEGGFGVVWMAEQEEPVRRRVALKIIKLGMDTREVVARFEAERQALALMDHQNIARVFDAGATVTGRPYFVMELVKGIPLTHFCDARRLSTRERLELFIRVCQAVQHAHQKGVIHRDLKPSNILVTVQDDRFVPKVIDFGVAKATQARLTEKTLFTRFQQWIGTPAYMSPEQAGLGSLDVDTRSDVYSLGVLLYELLTGRTPFDTERLLAVGYDAVMRAVREEEPPKPSTRLSTLKAEEFTAVAARRHADPARLSRLVRGDLDWIVMKALEKDRSRRYETASALVLQIQRYLRNEAVEVGAPPVGYRVTKFVRRHLAGVAVAAGFIALLALASVVSSGLALRAERERDRAVAAQAAEAKAQRETQDALSQMRLQKAEECLANDQVATALAYLARSLRDDQSNRVAAELLLATLTYRSTPRPLAEMGRHKTWIMTAEFSPDGRRVATASGDGTARVWNAFTGEPATAPLPHEGMVHSAQFSGDGLRVVTASGNYHTNLGYARVWDAQSGRPLTPGLHHTAIVWSAQFSPDGRRVVTSSEDKAARLWNAQTGEALTPPLPHDAAVRSAQFSPDGQRVLTVAGSSARLWDATGRLLREPLRHDGHVWSAQFSPEGRRVVTASMDGTVRIWDAEAGRPLGEPFKLGAAMSARFSPDGRRLATAWGDPSGGYARVWDAQTGQPLTEPMKHQDRAFSAQFSPDGLRLVTATDRGVARLWDAQTGQPLSEPIQHGRGIYSARFSPDGRQIVTASADGTAVVWDARPGRALPLALDHDALVNDARFSPDGERVLTASDDGTARLWQAAGGKPLLEPLSHTGQVVSAEFSPDGLSILTATTNDAYLWEARSGQARARFKPTGRIASAEFAADGKRVVTAGGTLLAGCVQVWSAATGKLLANYPQDRLVDYATFSADGQRLLTCSAEEEAAYIWSQRPGESPIQIGDVAGYVAARFSADGNRLLTFSELTTQVRDGHTGERVGAPLKHDSTIKEARFSPDGRYIVSASEDRSARVWEVQTAQMAAEPLKHPGAVTCASFSPDSRRVLTASLDGTVRVWDARTGRPLTEPFLHHGAVAAARFNRDGLRIITACQDRAARVWDIPAAPSPILDWLPELAEAVAGQRFTQKHLLEAVPPSEYLRLRQRLASGSGVDLYSRWARWFFADRDTRSISPFSSLTVPDLPKP